jgi:DNA mismatch endonuclease (patch repair protein)
MPFLHCSLRRKQDLYDASWSQFPDRSRLVDCFSKEQRSALMGRVRQRDTKPEVLLRKALWARGLRYRKHKKVAGIRPDLLVAQHSTAIFVDGCFWHGCPTHYSEPASNSTFWKNKIATNTQRDQSNNRVLTENGWRVIRIWECEIEDDLNAVVERVANTIKRLEPHPRDRSPKQGKKSRKRPTTKKGNGAPLAPRISRDQSQDN